MGRVNHIRNGTAILLAAALFYSCGGKKTIKQEDVKPPTLSVEDTIETRLDTSKTPKQTKNNQYELMLKTEALGVLGVDSMSHVKIIRFPDGMPRYATTAKGYWYLAEAANLVVLKNPAKYVDTDLRDMILKAAEEAKKMDKRRVSGDILPERAAELLYQRIENKYGLKELLQD